MKLNFLRAENILCPQKGIRRKTFIIRKKLFCGFFRIKRKKFIDKKTGNEFYDFIIERDGKLFNKYNTDKNYVLNQFKKPTKNLAFNGEYTKQPEALDALNGAYYNTKESLVNNDIFINGAIVNPNLLHISELYKNISSAQKELLNEVLAHTTK